MRVVLVGRAADRARLRRLLHQSIEVIGEAPDLPAARGLRAHASAFVLAADDDDASAVPETLTPREHQVLTLVAEGLSNKAAAARLGVSDETVKFHLASIFGKLGASNRTEAVRQALKLGLLPL